MNQSVRAPEQGSRLVELLACAYVASVPAFAFVPETTKFSQGIGVLLAATFMLGVLTKRYRLHVPAELLLFGIFLGYNLTGGFIAKELDVFISRQVTLFQLWILTIVVFNVFVHRFETRMPALVSYVVGVLLVTLWSMASISIDSTRRFAGVFHNPNTYGMILFLAIGFVLLLAIRQKASFTVATAVLALFLWQVTLTGSRKAMLGMILLLGAYAMVVVIRNRRRPIRALAVVVLSVVVTVVALGWLSTTPHWQRIQNLVLFFRGDDVAEISVYARADLLAAGVELWMENPFFGLGADQYRYNVSSLGLTETYSHSNFIEVLVNFGLVGAILFYSIYARLTLRLWSAWRRHRRTSREAYVLLAGALWVIWVGLEWAQVNYLNKSHWLLVSFLLVMGYNLERSREVQVS